MEPGPFRLGVFGAVGEDFDVVAIPGVEHDAAFFAFPPADLFFEAEDFGVELNGFIEVAGLDRDMMESAAADGWVGAWHSGQLSVVSGRQEIMIITDR